MLQQDCLVGVLCGDAVSGTSITAAGVLLLVVVWKEGGGQGSGGVLRLALCTWVSEIL
jgi:hypothetical protein